MLAIRASSFSPSTLSHPERMNNMTAAHILAFPILSLYFSSFHPSAVLCLQLISTMRTADFAGKLFHCKAICPSFHLLPIPLPQLKPKPLAARAHLSLWHSQEKEVLFHLLSHHGTTSSIEKIYLCFASVMMLLHSYTPSPCGCTVTMTSLLPPPGLDYSSQG